MILSDQIVKVKWSNRNKTYYMNLGYLNFKNGESFDVHINHLPLNSPATVEVVCDYCGKHHFNEYRKKSKSKNHFCCKECQDDFLIGKPSWNANKVIVNCAFCNDEIERSEWEIDRSKNLFCDRECANNYLKEFAEGRPKVERFTVNCNQCGTEIERTEKELERSKNHFCSKECSDKYSRGRMNYKNRNGNEVICYNCEIEFYLPNYRIESQDRYFCCNDCRKIWMQTEEFRTIMSNLERPTVDRIKVICFTCGEQFEKLPSEMRNEKHFCNDECWKTYFLQHNPNPKKDKIKVNCYNCGEEKFVNESVYKKNKYFFCCHECYQQKRMEISDFKNTGTSIHLKINDLLKKMNIKFVNEVPFGVYSLDIYLPDYSLGIEIMGDYWHGNPNKYKSKSELNNIQLKNISKDKRKNAIVNKKFNTKILYLWERDINKRIDLCEELIIQFIFNDNNLKDYHSFNYVINNSKLYLNENLKYPFWN